MLQTSVIIQMKNYCVILKNGTKTSDFMKMDAN